MSKRKCRICKHFMKIISVMGNWPFDRVLGSCESKERNNRVIMIERPLPDCEYFEESEEWKI